MQSTHPTQLGASADEVRTMDHSKRTLVGSCRRGSAVGWVLCTHLFKGSPKGRWVQSTHPTGFTLVEAVLSMLLVATVLVAAAEMVGASARARVVEKEQARSKELARQLLDEIMQNAYADPGSSPVFGPESGETRATFDDVDDFDNWQETPPRTKSGTPLPGYDGWRWKVKVSWADPANPGASSGSETGLKRIRVTVTTPTGKETTLTALRSKESAYAKKYEARTTYVGGVNITLQVGSETGAKVVSGVNLVNQVP